MGDARITVHPAVRQVARDSEDAAYFAGGADADVAGIKALS